MTCEVPLSESKLHDLRAHSCPKTGKYQGESSSLQGLVPLIVTVGDTMAGVCHTACAETWRQSGGTAGLTHRAVTAACSGDSSAISSPQPPISPGQENPTLFWISTGIKQNTEVLDKHFSTPVSMATPASLASHQHLWSRYIWDVPGKGHWECVHFNYVFCFERNAGNEFDLFTIQATSAPWRKLQDVSFHQLEFGLC